MADKAITDLGALAALADADLLVGVDDTDSTTKKFAMTVLNTYLKTGILLPQSYYETIWVPALSMTELATNGATPGSNEYATNDIMMDYFSFIKATKTFVAFSFPPPEGWDRSTIKFKSYWAPGDSACTAGDTAEWELQAGALSNDDAIDVALGTAQVISDTVLAGKNGDLHISDASPALTVGGTPALADLVHFKGSRNVGGTDDMAEVAWLFGFLIQFKLTFPDSSGINPVAAW
jgi:hypothetical protein